jgi:hypothetical protein
MLGGHISSFQPKACNHYSYVSILPYLEPGLKTTMAKRGRLYLYGTYAGGLFESGMLVLRGAALESARVMGHTAGIQQGFVLLPPRAVLHLCLYLRPVPAVAATVNAFWDYVLAEKLHESTPADWHYTSSQHVEIECNRIQEQRLLECLASAKERKLYPYIQHFGRQTCFEAWARLFTYEGEFPPPRGSFYVERQDWFDRVSHISLWR